MKATQPSSRQTPNRLVLWTLGALVALVVLTLVVLVHALSSSVAQGADISAGRFRGLVSSYTSDSAQVHAFTPAHDKFQFERKTLKVVTLQ